MTSRETAMKQQVNIMRRDAQPQKRPLPNGSRIWANPSSKDSQDSADSLYVFRRTLFLKLKIFLKTRSFSGQIVHFPYSSPKKFLHAVQNAPI
ncbi:hypothetical protein L596_005567 [Steinernema carpocapsae]|uniref:Uncharacterized protein n=1 Tax=Steinernema carpocapsae TaxID=34508 RepID=A0A4U8UZE6_STECR|nr:hypothetical protein L596_005567 [Steinernema carpocapsae]